MPSHAQDADMERDQCIAQSREAKSPVNREQDSETDQPRRYFEPPGETIVRTPSRPKDHHDHNCQQSEMNPRRGFHFFRASCTARLIAAIVLSGRAIFFPAISKAVP